MDINQLIKEGKRMIEARKLEEQLEREKRERENKAMLDAEMIKFVAQAIEPLRAMCDVIGINEVGVIDSYTWKKNVLLNVPLCTMVQAEFHLEGQANAFNPPREDQTWKFKRYLVPCIELIKWTDKGDEPWLAQEVFWSHDLEATEVGTLDEALALASDRFVEYALLEQDAQKRNEEIKVELARHAELEQARVDMERVAFEPFTWYKVYYALFATDDENEHFVEQGSFECMSDQPTSDGYFQTVRGKSVKPNFVTRVERMTCESVDKMPRWCPTVETEWGTIRVAPKNAEHEPTGGYAGHEKNEKHERVDDLFVKQVE